MDRLFDEGYLKLVGDSYFPTFLGVEQQDAELRGMARTWVAMALQALRDLYRRGDKDTFSLQEILREVQRRDPTMQELEVRIGILLAQDFGCLSGWGGDSTGAVSSVTVTEAILDFESVQDSWEGIKREKEKVRQQRSMRPQRLSSQGLLSSPRPPAKPRRPVDFSFVLDRKLGEIIRRDYGELQRAKEANAQKTRLILSGGLIEGLLLDALERNRDRALVAKSAEKDEKSRVGRLDEWNLSNLIDVAAELGLITEGAVKLSGVVRDFRNLIHPGKERRGDYEIGEEEARAAEAGLEAVIRDLKARAKGSS